MTTFMPPPPAATFLAFHPQDNNIIAIGMDDSTIQIYNVRIDEVLAHLMALLCVILIKNGTRFNQFFFLILCTGQKQTSRAL